MTCAAASVLDLVALWQTSAPCSAHHTHDGRRLLWQECESLRTIARTPLLDKKVRSHVRQWCAATEVATYMAYQRDQRDNPDG
jgi:hypothetical protein